MGTIRELTDIGMPAIEAKFLAVDGYDASYAGWTIPVYISSDNEITSLLSSAVYASASSFTIPYDVTDIIAKGDRFKCNNTTIKYGVVKSVSYSAPNTTVNIFVNNDYTIANSAITNLYFSKHQKPQDFPLYFNWTPTFGAQAGTFTLSNLYHAVYSVQGGDITYSISFSGNQSVANADYLTFTLPATTVNLSASSSQVTLAEVGENGPNFGFFDMTNNSTECRVFKNDWVTEFNGSGAINVQGNSFFKWN